ncbi:hypothetical protein J5N94_00085, partial [Pseudomonas aeruginosa]|nr:hypothetical protein [Pseudomonas aeruginosa]
FVFVNRVQKELSYHVLQKQRRMGVVDGADVLQNFLVAAYSDADVFLAQQAGCQYLRRGI